MATQAADLTRLMDNARIHLPGALDAALKLELFNVLDDFLQSSKFWQEGIEYTARAGRREYELVGTEQGAIVELLSNVNGLGVPVRASMLNLGTLVLDNEVSETQEFTATVAYTVVDPTGSDDYPVIPEELLHKYGVGILSGLVGRMMLQPAKPYSNQQMAIYHSRKFSSATAEARAAVKHKNIHGGQTWRFPSFARGHQR